jgi:hypothetical protein
VRVNTRGNHEIGVALTGQAPGSNRQPVFFTFFMLHPPENTSMFEAPPIRSFPKESALIQCAAEKAEAGEGGTTVLLHLRNLFFIIWSALRPHILYSETKLDGFSIGPGCENGAAGNIRISLPFGPGAGQALARWCAAR